MSNTIMVPESQRRQHSRDIEQRNTWRRQYATLTSAIRRSKIRLRIARSMFQLRHELDELATLEVLRDRASLMMMHRELIKHNLRRSSYRWATLEESATA